ncbi:MAG: PilZ domain-containing protein [Syntrophorhabdaceae bacterium]|nr:PilZ domain-containing protein [Syntrophorhabdaceae bacterium]MDD4197453.1 PilZ domain-containing protein [Syntrophorhabdaceae bacterium]HOC45161.1 PilZ domain-containing protein [Syntrophorhabdaceae bacterium]
MKTSDKKSLIVLRKKHLVNRYLDEIIRDNLSARVIIDGTITLDECRIISSGREEGIVLDTGLMAGEYPESGHAAVTFAGPASFYQFSTPMLSIDIAENRRMRLMLQFPYTITKRAKRRHIRVKPHVLHPVTVRLLVANSETIDVKPVDISESGISFMLTEYVTRFKSGDPVDLIISIPKTKNVSAGAVIKNVIHLMDLTRIGVEFSMLSDEAMKTILEYIELCEQEMGPYAYDEE